MHKFKVLIVDELHMMMSKSAIEVYKKLINCSVRVGVSATPFKYEIKKKGKVQITGDEVQKYAAKGHFGPQFKVDSAEGGELTVSQLQEEGRLSKAKCVFFEIDHPKLKHALYGDAVTYGIAQSAYFHQIVKKIACQLKGRTIILVERLAHGDTLHQLIPGSLWVQGKDDEEARDHVIDQLRNAKGDVIAICSGIFNTGVDFFCHSFINAAGGKASHEITQRFGRGLRPAGDKQGLLYIDFVFKINEYLEEHSYDRIEVLKSEEHEIEIRQATDESLCLS